MAQALALLDEMSERGIPKDAAVYRALAHFDAQAYTYLRRACFRRARFRRTLRASPRPPPPPPRRTMATTRASR